MKRRLVIVTEIVSPYRIPLFNALAKEERVDLHVIFLAETDPGLRQWRVYKEEIQFSYEVLRSKRKRVGRYNFLWNWGVSAALAAAKPDVILCGGYNYPASWRALWWARRQGVAFFLWSESNPQDQRRGHALVELLKHEFVSRCNGFVVPGQTAREYLRVQGIGDGRIFPAPNAVDNDLFAQAAAKARQDAAGCRKELGLPARYFVFVGRLVPEKGVFDLLSAYAKLNDSVRKEIGLVFVGDGESREQLEKRAASISPGTVKFAGFAQREQLAAYYALADVLVLPTYSDTWGLVVNEAMSCGLAVVLSRAAGCAADLVRAGENGWLISAGDIAAMAEVMEEIARNPETCAAMGAQSARHIESFSPAAWSAAIATAMGDAHA
jgi:glycosyltransferase involved in cell wall biosynthesis